MTIRREGRSDVEVDDSLVSSDGDDNISSNGVAVIVIMMIVNIIFFSVDDNCEVSVMRILVKMLMA